MSGEPLVPAPRRSLGSPCLPRAAAALAGGLAFAAAGSRIALATSDLMIEKGHAEAWAAALLFMGALVLAFGHVRSARRSLRLAAQTTSVVVALVAIVVFAAPGVAMLH